MTWDEWLQTDEATPVISKCAVYITQKFHFTLEVLGEDNANDLVGFIWEYCKSNSDKWNKAKPFSYLRDRGTKQVANWIIKNILRAIGDKSRSMQYSPQRYLYSRLRATLSSSYPDVKTYDQQNATYYTFDKDLRWNGDNLFSSKGGSYGGWPFPNDISLKDIYKKTEITRVAKFFWEQVKTRTGSEQWIPIRELVRYISSFMPIVERHLTESIDSSRNEDNGVPVADLETELLKHFENSYKIINPENLLMAEDVAKLARKCSLKLSPEERKALCLYHNENFPMKEVAYQLNYPNPSSIHHILEKAYKKIRRFCETVPYLSPPGLDKELFNKFMENLFSFCKNSLRDRI